MRLKTFAMTAITATGLALVLTTQSGCLVAAAAAAGAGTYAYVNGEMTQNVDAPVEKVAAATKSVFDDMQAMIYEYTPNATESKIYARTKSDHRVEVLVRPITEKASKISIRVDNFGDEGISRDVLNRIQDKLKS